MQIGAGGRPPGRISPVLSAGRLSWFTACVLYVLIWWVALFAILPLWVRTAEQPDDTSGWRGAPDRPMLLRKAWVTTLVAAIVWALVVLVIKTPFLSFRHGILALPIN